MRAISPNFSTAAVLAVALFTTTLAHASGDGQRSVSDQDTQAQSTPPELLTAEQRSQQIWDSLREVVPDLDPEMEAAEAQALSSIPEAEQVDGAPQVCGRFPVQGSRIKRRACLTAEEVTVVRDGRFVREVRFRYRGVLLRR